MRYFFYITSQIKKMDSMKIQVFREFRTSTLIHLGVIQILFVVVYRQLPVDQLPAQRVILPRVQPVDEPVHVSVGGDRRRSAAGCHRCIFRKREPIRASNQRMKHKRGQLVPPWDPEATRLTIKRFGSAFGCLLLTCLGILRGRGGRCAPVAVHVQVRVGGGAGHFGAGQFGRRLLRFFCACLFRA